MTDTTQQNSCVITWFVDSTNELSLGSTKSRSRKGGEVLPARIMAPLRYHDKF